MYLLNIQQENGPNSGNMLPLRKGNIAMTPADRFAEYPKEQFYINDYVTSKTASNGIVYCVVDQQNGSEMLVMEMNGEKIRIGRSPFSMPNNTLRKLTFIELQLYLLVCNLTKPVVINKFDPKGGLQECKS